ncbi:MAG: biotin/lipoate A/B protein ligase family protein [Acidimicrobiales bacterium]
MVEPLRIIDFGCSSPLRSQTLWHAIAYGVSASEKATLSFTRPGAPYVCLGYHRGIDEVDGDYCLDNGLPLLRRMVGGGPVYLDADQLFFQICLPARAVPASSRQALRVLLEPAVTAFRAVGVPAVLDDDLEICAGDSKICGHGAARIEDAVVVCGNLIERFDHERAAGVLAFDDRFQRDQTLALMRRFVSPTAIEPAVFRAAIISAYASALGLDPQAGWLSGPERRALTGLDERYKSDAWLAGPTRPATSKAGKPTARQVKVRAGVWTLGASYDGAHVAAGVVRGTIDQVRLQDRGLNGATDRAERALTGIPLQSVARVLDGFGDPGRRLAAAFAMADPARL